MNATGIHKGMSNFEVSAARKRNISMDMFRDTCGWTSAEVIKRVMAARKDEEWLFGEGPDAIRVAKIREANQLEKERQEAERLKIIHVEGVNKHLDNEYEISYNALTQIEKNALGREYIHDIMCNMDIPHTNSDKTGIHFELSNSRDVVIRTKALDNDGWLIHDDISKLKGDIFIYVYNMGQRIHNVYIMTRADVLKECYHIPAVGDKKSQSIIPQKILRVYKNNFSVLE